MNTVTRIFGATLVAVVATFVGLPAAHAASVRVSDLVTHPKDDAATFTLTGVALPAGAGLDPQSVEVSVGARALSATVSTARTETSGPSAIRVVLAMDTSGSMAGTPLADAKRAANDFVAATPAHVEIGLVTFAEEPAVVQPPTRDRAAVLGAVARATAGGGTALYDGVASGLAALGGTGDRRLVVLSDGADTRSRAGLAATVAAARRSGAVIEAVGLRTPKSVTAVLQQLAGATHGRFLRAQDRRSLASALTSTARTYATALDVRVLVPADLAVGESELRISVATSTGPLVTTAAMDFGGTASGRVVADEHWLGSRQSLFVGLAAIGGAVLLGFAALVAGPGRDRQAVRGLLARYTTKEAQARSLRQDRPVTRSALEFAERVVQSRGMQDRLALRLERAAISMAPNEWLLLQAGVSFGLVLLLVLLGLSPLIALVAGVLFGFGGTSLFVRLKASRRQAAFDGLLPDMLQLLSGSLSAGYSLPQALDGVVREGTEPIAAEFGRALAESRIGIPVEDTLDSVAERMGSKDFRWVVMAIRVQKEVGGNLAGILASVAATMRERTMLRRHVKALAAEGKLSAYILLGLPPALAVYMLVVRPEYIRPLYTTNVGFGLIGVALVLTALGTLWMKKIVSVEV